MMMLAVGCRSASVRPEVPEGTTTMAAIPAGAFLMGTDSAALPSLLARYHTTHADLFASEMPRHAATLAAYEMDRTEVSKAQFRDFVTANPQWARGALAASTHNGRYLDDWSGADYPAGEANRPVAFITLPAAAAYCAWAGKRLPTEGEGSSPRAAVLEFPSSHGAMHHPPRRAPTGSAPTSVTRVTLARFRRTVTACSTWRATCGSSRPTGGMLIRRRRAPR